jgi:leader peptidase (prepilin peptidase)/N-methyltransferase
MEFFAHPPAWLLSPAALALFGLCIGSFLNVVIHRLPLMLERLWLADVQAMLRDRPTLQRNLGQAIDTAGLAQLDASGARLEAALATLTPLGLSQPRSRCPHCGTQLRWFHNLPLVSWLVLRGRCASCGHAISWRYPLVEACTAMVFAVTAHLFGPTATTVVYCAAAAMLIAAALIDLDTTLLPDNLTYPLLALGLFAAWQGWTPVSLADSALGVLFGYGSLWLLATTYQAIRSVAGMAEGDFKLLAALGALLGVAQLLPIVLLSSVVGSVVGLFLIFGRGHRSEVPIPFGPYLAGGGLAAVFWGPQLLHGLLLR